MDKYYRLKFTFKLGANIQIEQTERAEGPLSHMVVCGMQLGNDI